MNGILWIGAIGGFESFSTDDLEAAVRLARGPFMAGFALRGSPTFDEWQALQGARVEQMVGSLVVRLRAPTLMTIDSITP